MNKCRQNSCKQTQLYEPNNLKSALNIIKSQDPQNIAALVSFENELESKRTEYLNSWIESISHLRDKLSDLKLEVRNDFTMEIRDAEYYRVNMFQLEEKISEIKENIKNEFYCLLKEESELDKEIQLTERRVGDWGKPLNSNTLKPTANGIYRIQRQEVKSDALGEFQKFLTKSGGHYGGWEEQDHLLFLRERRKYNGKPKFLSAVHSILPDIKQEEIEAHENWYQKYELLKGLQKEAIKKWRDSRSIFKDQSNPRPELKDPVNDSNNMKNITYQRDITERIKEWKRQQQLRKAEKEEMEKRVQQNHTEERLRKRELQKAKKLVVEKYKAEKMNRIQSELMASQKIKELQAIEDRARKSLLLKVFREQDEQYIARIKLLRSQSASKGKEKLDKFESVKGALHIVVGRDRRRLLKPTQVWNQHCLQQDNHIDKSTKIMNLQTIPHLAVPSWRKGLNNI